MVEIVAYGIFVPLAFVSFAVARIPVRVALLLVLLGGWWLLPIARYPVVAPSAGLPWWITGIALPSDLLLTKAWTVPLVALAGAAIRDPAALRRWRPRAIDAVMAAWCLWPLVDGVAVRAVGGAPDPSPAMAALYVAGAWGLPWLIGRVWFAGAAGGMALVRGIALSGLANVPLAVLEGVRPAWLYNMVYAPHPFGGDGVDRYIGYRPIGFLEHGNLYGLWAALAAFAAVWLARQGDDRRWSAVAVVTVVVALASQSAGAIVLLGVGVALLATWRLPVFLPALAAGAGALLLVGAVHLSGVLPLQRMAYTPLGQQAIGAMRAIGRGSLLWRVSQDAKTLPTVAAAPLGGTARWDWWLGYGTRPWGQALLLVGQYGLIGFALAWGSLIAAAAAALLRLREWGERPEVAGALPLAIVVLLALGDALFNAFFFAPAIVAAGAVAAGATARVGGGTSGTRSGTDGVRDPSQDLTSARRRSDARNRRHRRS